jgi:hypothetical protein
MRGVVRISEERAACEKKEGCDKRSVTIRMKQKERACGMLTQQKDMSLKAFAQ